ncbi:MAG: putative membrane protein [Planctomycetota bacterium]|jgi:putative membrane protein
MIKYDNKNWFSFIFRNGGKHVDGMLWSTVVMALLTILLIWLEKKVPWFHIDMPSTFHTVLGLVLGLLLVFRTNSAYDRWWEGRKQLGLLVNTTRNLAIKIQVYVKKEDYAEKELLQDLIYALAFSIKEHLQEKEFNNILKEIPVPVQNEFMNVDHKPNYLLGQIAFHLEKMIQNDVISGEKLIILEKETNTLINVLGACERIGNTPIPMAYALHLKRILLVYCLSLPFGFIGNLSWFAVPVVLVVFYTMVGIELIGEEIEDPFGMDENDLPVEELCNKIKANILEIKKYK